MVYTWRLASLVGFDGFSQVRLRLPRQTGSMFPVQTMPLRSTPITGASSLLRAAVPRIYEPFPAHAAGVLTNLRRPDGRCAVRGSLVPCILAFHGSFSLSLWPGCHHWLV